MPKQKLKISFITRSLFPLIGGSETYVYEMARIMSQKGHDVSVITSDLPDKYSLKDGYPFEVLRVAGLSDFNHGRLNSRTLVSLFHAIKSLNPDVISAHNILIGLALSLIYESLPPATACFFTDHNTPCSEKKRWLSGINCFEVEKSIGQFVLRSGRFDYMITPSKAFYNWAINNGAPVQKVVQIFHGVDDTLYYPAEDSSLFKKRLWNLENEKVILSPGRFLRRKGQDKLLKAFETISANHADIHLVLTTTENTSEPEFKEFILESIKTHPFKNRIHVFIDHYNPLDMPDIYRASDCVAYLSDYEGFGLVGIEALASGVPLVGKMVQGLNEYLSDEITGLVCQNNIDSTVTQIERALTDKYLRKNVINNGLNLIREKFSLQTSASIMESLFLKTWEKKNSIKRCKNVV